MPTRTLEVKIIGNAASAEAAMIAFGKSVETAQRSTSVGAAQIYNDLHKMEAAAKAAADANERLGKVGAGGGASSAIQDMLRMGGGGNVSNAALNKVADSLDTTAGKAAAAGIGIAAVGAVAVKFGVDAVHSFVSAAEAVEKFRAVSGASVHDSSVFVNVAQQMGVSIDTMDTAIGRMLKNLDKQGPLLAQYNIQIAKTASGNTDTVQTFENIVNALNAIQEPQERATAGAAIFGRGWVELAPYIAKSSEELQRFFASASQHGAIFNNEEELDSAFKMHQKLVELGQEWKKFEVTAGEIVTPILSKWVSFAEFMARMWGDVFHGVALGAQALIDGLQGIFGALSHLPSVGGKFGEIHDALAGIDIAGHGAADGIAAANPPTEDLGNSATITAGKLYTLSDAMSSAGKAWTGMFASQTVGIAATDDYNSSLTALDSAFTSTASDSSAAADTVAKGAQQISDAQQAVSDALDNVTQAQTDYARAVQDANQNIADVEESTSKSIVDAQNKIIDARKRAADQALSSSRSVADAEQALRDAEVNSLSNTNPYQAQRQREDAALHLQRAQEDAGNAAVDSAKGISDAQKDLADVETKAAEDRAKAQQAAADKISAAQKQIQSAEDAVSKASEGVSRAMDSVGQANVKAAAKVDAHTVSQQAYDQAVQKTMDATPAFILDQVSRGVPLDQINTKLQAGIDKLKGQGQQLGLNTQLVDIYDQHAQTAVLDVLRMTQDTYDLYVFLNKAAAAVHTDAANLSADAAFLGVPLQRDSGGVLPQGLSAVMNASGKDEWVLTEDQIGGIAGRGGHGGGGTTVNIGTVLDGRGLANVLADLKRQGLLTAVGL